MVRFDITVPTPVVLLLAVTGMFVGAGYSWFSVDDRSHSVQATASNVLDVGVASASASQPEPTGDTPAAAAVAKSTTRTATRRAARVRVSDESTIGPGTASILRRKRGEYAGRLVPINGTSACARVAKAFFRMRADAQRNGVRLYVVSGFRTRGHQIRLYRELGPVYAARPGKSLHRRATELDIRMRAGGGDRTHRWLIKHGARFGFVQRYSWEPWHWGYVRGC